MIAIMMMKITMLMVIAKVMLMKPALPTALYYCILKSQDNQKQTRM